MTSESSLPYNTCNRALSPADLGSLLTVYGHDGVVTDINLYRNSFVHRSYCTRKNENFVNGNVNCPPGCLPLQEESNERLEFLGDAVINLIIGRYLFERFPDENEGFLTKMRTKLVNGNMLAHLGKLVDLGKYVIISRQIEDNGGRSNKKVLEDCFEAFVGAMFLDSKSGSSVESVEVWLIRLIEENIDFSDLIAANNNFKDMMLKHYQHTFGYVPRFYEISAESHRSSKVYRICLKDNLGVVIATGTGGTKKEAENDCAKIILKTHGLIPQNS